MGKLRLFHVYYMEADGDYTSKTIAADEAKALYAEFPRGEIISYIGYKNTADLLSYLFGENVPFSTGETFDVEDGDTMLVCTLKQRYQGNHRLRPKEVLTLADVKLHRVDYKAPREEGL